MKKKIIISIILYIIVWVLLYWSATYWWNLPWVYRWILAPSILIAKDFFVFWNNAEIESITISHIDWDSISNDISFKKLPRWYPIVLLVRTYCFPFFLVVYLLYLLINQTQIRNLHISTAFLVLNKNFLLFMTIITWVIMIFWEKYDDTYMIKRNSLAFGWVYFLVISLLSIIWGYIVLQQILELGIIWMVIANVVVLLLFFVGLLLMEETENSL